MIGDTQYPDFKEVADGIEISKKLDEEKDGEFEVLIHVKSADKDHTTVFSIWNDYDTDNIYIGNSITDLNKDLPGFNKLAAFLGIETKTEVLVKKEEVIKEVVPEEIKVEMANLKGKVDVFDRLFGKREITINQ